MTPFYQQFLNAEHALLDAISNVLGATDEPLLRMKLLEADTAYVIAKAKLDTIKWEMANPTLEAMQADPSKLDYFANILPACIAGTVQWLRDQQGGDTLTRLCEVFKVAQPLCRQLGADANADLSSIYYFLDQINHLPANIGQQARAAIGSVVTLKEGG